MESKLSFARELKDKFIFLNSFPVARFGYFLNLHQRAAVLIRKDTNQKKRNEADKI
jgi:hypothetical protein